MAPLLFLHHYMDATGLSARFWTGKLISYTKNAVLGSVLYT